MLGRRSALTAIACGLVGAPLSGCHHDRPAPPPPAAEPALPAAPKRPPRPPIPNAAPAPPLASGETYVYDKGVARRETAATAQAAGLLDVDLSDGWAPFIFQDGDAAEAKPNRYRATFVGLASERLNADGDPARPGDENFLEVFGIPPTFSVLARRAEADVQRSRESCYDAVDRDALERWTGDVAYLDREHARREYDQAVRDAAWLERAINAPAAPSSGAAGGDVVLANLQQDPRARARIDRAHHGQARLRAVRAAQARLVCEGLLSSKAHFTPGMYDLPTHEALALWERKNDIFGWGFLGGETAARLLAPNRELLFDAFKRALAERVADAAGIVEDGSAGSAGKGAPPSWRDAAGNVHAVPNLIGDYVDALLAALGVSTPEQMIAFLRAHAQTGGISSLHVAFKAPPLPDYYAPEDDAPGAARTSRNPGATSPSRRSRAPEMNISAEIDRGDVWYDFPFDKRGKPVVQRRDHYPHLTVFVHWRGQKIPLADWRTTIGSWRSELHPDGRVYMKYKSSDVGPRVWRTIVAAPVWIPPDGTPAKDLLTRKVLDRNVGAVTVVNTGVMGPGYQSAYGLVMGIHIDPKRGGFDNQIRTHGSVDYTSIARRFSHGCHRLVNNRAVRLFDFVLRHRSFRRVGDVPLNVRKRFEVDGQAYEYTLESRGYYYQLAAPVPVEVLEGRIMGQVKSPIVTYVRKPGVDYGPDPASSDAAASTSLDPAPAPAETALERGASRPPAEQGEEDVTP